MIDFIGELAKYGLDETSYETCLKDIEDKVNGNNDLDWQEICNKFSLDVHPDHLRKSSSAKPFGRVFVENYKAYKNATNSASDSYLKEIKTAQYELEKERIKMQTVIVERNRLTREQARDELIGERICDAIKELQPLEIPQLIHRHSNSRAGVLLIADAHYGTELLIRGFFGEVLNEYSPEIFERRMWDLLGKTIEIVKKEGFTELNTFLLGDEIDGLLRVSQLMKLRYGVVESTVRFARFIVAWLNELSKHVRVKFQMVRDSNHMQLRMLGEKKNTFKDDNMSIIIMEKIIDKLADNPNFEFIQNPTGYIYDEILGYSVLGIHGEVKNLEQAIKDFSNTYKVKIDVLCAAHKHHQASSCVGIASEVIGAPSLIGLDDYSLSLNKSSDAGATLFVLEEGVGKTCEYSIKLK